MLGRNPVVSERKYIYCTEEKVFRRSYFINIANSRREKQANALMWIDRQAELLGKLFITLYVGMEESIVS